MPPANLIVDAGAALATVTVNRPRVLNALDDLTLHELSEAFAELAAAPGIRCVILTGAGEKAFVAGADIAAMAQLDAAGARQFAERGGRLAAQIEALPAPVIAAVNGFALGGGLELALACDFAIAATNARVGLPEVGLGVIPGFGGTQRLARRIGVGRARELIYTGDVIGADEAARLGIVNAVVEPGELMPRARAVAEKIASRAPLAVAAAKRAVREGTDTALAPALALERELFASLFATADQKEGMRAFVDKRPPRFAGN